MTKELFFFIGTEAELIKVFPVIAAVNEAGLTSRIIASGQNNIATSSIFTFANCGPIDLELSHESEIKKNALGLLSWWRKTYTTATEKIKNAFPNTNFSKAVMIVHGDTVSTYMGAKIAKKLDMKICHIEAGLRSHNLFSPFPEEIDRLLTSRIARLHFAPGNTPVKNLQNAKGIVVNTKVNTLIDSLRYSKKIPLRNSKIAEIINEKYFVFVIHRQENLVKKSFVCAVVKEILEAAKHTKAVIVLHKITENAFIRFGLYDELKNNPNVIFLPRMDYFDFMKLLQNSQFVITDGGSNQEELYYMNKPCLILRTTTERNEGLGINARLFNGQPSDIGTFIGNLSHNNQNNREPQWDNPSQIITNTLQKIIANKSES